MRRKKHGEERIAACAALLAADPDVLKENPQAFYPSVLPLHLEIGCGKGNFACGMAAAHPEWNFLAMDLIPDVVCTALEKARDCAETRPGDNLRFLIGNANKLTEAFPAHSVDVLYLNFSDPWPKSGHAKRRLTWRGFLEQYRTVLKPGGILRLKTDNEGLFDFSVEEFEAAGLTFLWQTRDLHHSEYVEGNVMTEYESNFTAKGQPIYSACVRFDPKPEAEVTE
jgi:tRNA (guanine-N7-)-methyltransferase